MERTLVIIKPDGVQRGLIGPILTRLERRGLRIAAMKLMQITPDLARQHYAEHVDQPFYPGLERFITGAPVVAMIVQGLDVIRVVREMLGPTSGLKAEAGTIRGDYSSSRQMNLVHASDGAKAARREIELYFADDEICDFQLTLVPWLKAVDE